MISSQTWRLALYPTLVGGIALAFFVLTQYFWVPAHGGVDQNAYLVGARNLLLHGTMVQRPPDLFAFVGRMWVTGIEPGTFYPKYPIGLPAIFAVALGVGGVKAVYLVNPIAMTLALVATFLFVRRFAGSFYGALAMLVMALSPVTTNMTNMPTSHATVVFCVAWGMYLLWSWWDAPKAGLTAWARAVGAGALLGVAVTIRYSEVLLFVPMAIVVLFVVSDRASRRDGALQSLAMAFAWAIPVAALVRVNLRSFGTWTGYELTNESTAFSWTYFGDYWDKALTQLTTIGLVFVFPLAIVGLAMLFRSHLRSAVVIAAWILPSLFLHTAWHVDPDTSPLGFTRFFLTTFPALLAAAAVALKRIDEWPSDVPRRDPIRFALWTAAVFMILGAVLSSLKGGWGRAAWEHGHSVLGFVQGAGVGAGIGLFVGYVMTIRPATILIVAGCAVACATSLGNLRSELRAQTIVQMAGDRIQQQVPEGAVLFSKENVLDHVQFLGDWQCYWIDLFTEGRIQKLASEQGSDEPQEVQADRFAALDELVKDDSGVQLAGRFEDLTNTAIERGQRVFLVLPERDLDSSRRRLLTEYDTKVLDEWVEPPSLGRVRDRRVVAETSRRRQPHEDAVNTWQLIEVTWKLPSATLN